MENFVECFSTKVDFNANFSLIYMAGDSEKAISAKTKIKKITT